MTGVRPLPPKRIQRKRTKGWRMPEGAVYVGRPSRWGNQTRVGACGECQWGSHDGDHRPMDAVEATGMYRIGWEATLMAEASIGEMTPDELRLCGVSGIQIDHLAPLRGPDLACWCPLACGVGVDRGWSELGGPYDPCALPAGHDGDHDPSEQPAWCHADVLLELANHAASGEADR